MASTPNSSALGRTLITLVALVTSTGCFIADWNETHIYNPLWPGHAKFHNGQTMSMGLSLGLLTLYYLYRSPPSPASSSSKPSSSSIFTATSRKSDVNIASVLASLYWVTQLSAYMYPDVTANDNDPEFWYLQFCLSCVCLGLVGVGRWLEVGAVGAK